MEEIQKALAEKIINWTFPGLTFYYRDTELSTRQQEKYALGKILRNGFFLDVSSTAGAPTQNTRFIIASSKAAPVYLVNPDMEKYGLHVLNLNSYFKVMDIHEAQGFRQIFLLHIPAKGIDFFRQSQTNFDGGFIEKARTSLTQKLAKGVMPVFQSAEWIDKTKFAVGLDAKDKPFPLAPSPVPPQAAPLFEGLKKMAKDTDDLNVYVGGSDKSEKQGFWNKLFGK